MVRLPALSRIMVGLASLYLVFNRDTYLPFFGETVYPCAGFADKVPDDATLSILVKVPPRSKVVYWASEHSKDMAPDPYDNAGVVTADQHC